jgi:hypothetical protein
MFKKKLSFSENKTLRSILQDRGIGAALILILGIIGLVGILQLYAHLTTPHSLARLNQPIPSIMMENAGTYQNLKKYLEGTRCVLVFYSPACRICKEVVPYLYPLPKGLRLILINESSNKEDTLIAQFPKADRLQDPHRTLAQTFPTLSLPTILLIDERGILRDGLAGRHQRNFIQQKLNNFAVRSFLKTDKAI